jgi:AraC family transcriptional regulator of adaptative response/methylated-DNA-[protein]-cysteine methyltransferase
MSHPLSDPETLYTALLQRDSTFEGIFVVGVKTTGVFCRPTCRARMPKRENVEFFDSAHEALLHGYRPCKICTPLEYKGAPPAWLRPLLEEINEATPIKLKDSHLRQRGLNPSRVRYWFKKQHGMTFQEYLRVLRIGQAFGRIRHGEKVASTAFESGYQSLSGFAETFKKTADFAPSRSQGRHLIPTTDPLWVLCRCHGRRCLLESLTEDAETQLSRVSKLLNKVVRFPAL